MASTRTPLRLWPGVVLVFAQWLFWFGLSLFKTDALILSLPLVVVGMFAGMICGVAIVIWWLFFSRAPWVERLGALVLMIAAVFVTRYVVHESIGGGMRGMMLPVSSFLRLSRAGCLGRGHQELRGWPRRAALVVALFLACVPWTLLRTGGSAVTAPIGIGDGPDSRTAPPGALERDLKPVPTTPPPTEAPKVLPAGESRPVPPAAAKPARRRRSKRQLRGPAFADRNATA